MVKKKIGIQYFTITPQVCPSIIHISTRGGKKGGEKKKAIYISLTSLSLIRSPMRTLFPGPEGKIWIAGGGPLFLIIQSSRIFHRI